VDVLDIFVVIVFLLFAWSEHTLCYCFAQSHCCCICNKI